MTTAQIQVGASVGPKGVVKIRTPDEKRPGGYIVQRLSARAARVLADWLSDGVPGKMLKVSDGVRWVEFAMSSEGAVKIAADLRRCARLVA